MKNFTILAIESSCDETAAAVVRNGRDVLSSTLLSQIEEHRLYGGVVPEIASRRHVEAISPIVQKALDDSGERLSTLDAIAVTAGPGLIGALLVGVNFGKGLALSRGLPLIPVHHIRGHVASNYLAHPQLAPPFLCLVVSGGHSHIVWVKDYTTFKIIGRTRDDAAGEAFDKAARTMGLPYPGGVAIDAHAKTGNPLAYALPYPKLDTPFDFSFSGLKTALINRVHNMEQAGTTPNTPDLAASFQKTVTEILTDTFFRAAEALNCPVLACAGGVSANSELRYRLTERAKETGRTLYLPPLSLCGDNAAMIGAQAFYEYQAGNLSDMSLNAYASYAIDQAFPL